VPDIMIVDDDRDILTVLEANLKLHGFVVLPARTAQGAREIMAEETPDLVVLDLILPDGDGMDLCREWKSVHRSLPIIMLTARDMVSDRVLGLESGADDYMVKPFEPIELIARIRACLRRYRPADTEVVRVGNLVIDRASMTVSVRGKKVDLTPREYQLLNLLVDHRNRVLSRDFIRRSLWKESQVYSWSRVIDVHIQHLRQKIEPDQNSPSYIRTVVGTGYMFECDE